MGFSKRVAPWLCLLTLALAPALSAQEKKPASAPPAPSASPPASTPANVANPVPDARRESAASDKKSVADPAPVQDGAIDASKAPSKPGETPAAKEPPKPVPHAALILPLNSKTFGKLADAVRQGFVAASMADGKEAIPFRVYPTEDDAGALAKEARRAAAEGAVLLLGGVTRDGANLLSREAGYLPALALNAPTVSDAEMPERFFHVSLNLDWEARQVARRAGDEGAKRIVVAASNSPLARRVQESFEKEWTRRGGEIASRIVVTGDLAEGDRIVAAFEKASGDSAFLIADKKIARFARPYFPQGMPVYATSYTIDPRADAVENLDLDGVRFMEMPWFVEADHPAVMAFPKPTEVMPIDFERLYALGIDAWRLATAIIKADKGKPFAPLDGVTGRIVLDGKQFVRTLTAAELRDGHIVARAAVE